MNTCSPIEFIHWRFSPPDKHISSSRKLYLEIIFKSMLSPSRVQNFNKIFKLSFIDCFLIPFSIIATLKVGLQKNRWIISINSIVATYIFRESIKCSAKGNAATKKVKNPQCSHLMMDCIENSTFYIKPVFLLKPIV